MEQKLPKTTALGLEALASPLLQHIVGFLDVTTRPNPLAQTSSALRRQRHVMQARGEWTFDLRDLMVQKVLDLEAAFHQQILLPLQLTRLVALRVMLAEIDAKKRRADTIALHLKQVVESPTARELQILDVALPNQLLARGGNRIQVFKQWTSLIHGLLALVTPRILELYVVDVGRWSGSCRLDQLEAAQQFWGPLWAHQGSRREPLGANLRVLELTDTCKPDNVPQLALCQTVVLNHLFPVLQKRIERLSVSISSLDTNFFTGLLQTGLKFPSLTFLSLDGWWQLPEEEEAAAENWVGLFQPFGSFLSQAAPRLAHFHLVIAHWYRLELSSQVPLLQSTTTGLVLDVPIAQEKLYQFLARLGLPGGSFSSVTFHHPCTFHGTAISCLDQTQVASLFAGPHLQTCRGWGHFTGNKYASAHDILRWTSQCPSLINIGEWASDSKNTSWELKRENRTETATAVFSGPCHLVQDLSRAWPGIHIDHLDCPLLDDVQNTLQNT